MVQQELVLTAHGYGLFEAYAVDQHLGALLVDHDQVLIEELEADDLDTGVELPLGPRGLYLGLTVEEPLVDVELVELLTRQHHQSVLVRGHGELLDAGRDVLGYLDGDLGGVELVAVVVNVHFTHDGEPGAVHREEHVGARVDRGHVG